MIDEAKDSLVKTRQMKKYANRGRWHVEFGVGERVFQKLTPQIWRKINSKIVYQGLIPKYDRPFRILSRVGNVAYLLKLLDR